MPNPTYLADYITVADRLAQFVVDYPDGRIQTELVFSTYDPASAKGFVVVRAEVFKGTFDKLKDATPDGTGLASMPVPGVTNFTKNSEVENTETSAVGRALAMIGYLSKTPDGKPQISSKEEIENKDASAQVEDDPNAPITQKQRGLIFARAKQAGINPSTAAGKATLQQVTKEATGKYSSKQLVMSDVDKMLDALEKIKIVVAATGGGEVVG